SGERPPEVWRTNPGPGAILNELYGLEIVRGGVGVVRRVNGRAGQGGAAEHSFQFGDVDPYRRYLLSSITVSRGPRWVAAAFRYSFAPPCLSSAVRSDDGPFLDSLLPRAPIGSGLVGLSGRQTEFRVCRRTVHPSSRRAIIRS